MARGYRLAADEIMVLVTSFKGSAGEYPEGYRDKQSLNQILKL